MTPLMERVILTMQAFGDSEVSLDQIRKSGRFDSGREVAVCLHYLVNREGLATVRDVGGSRDRPAVWKLTDLGRLYRPLLTLGTPPDAKAIPTAPESKPTPRKAPRARPKKAEPACTVADLAQEIKTEQDAAVAAIDTGRDPRTAPKPAWVREARKLFEPPVAAADAERDPKPDPRLNLTLASDGTLTVSAVGTELNAVLTPAQTSQLGEFLISTAGVWQSPF